VSVVVQDASGLPPDSDDAALWADGLGLTFPVLADEDGEFYPVWDPMGVLPMAYVIDQDGVVAWAEAGGAGGLEEMEAQVVTLLGE
jgi:peroxiredoxin